MSLSQINVSLPLFLSLKINNIFLKKCKNNFKNIKIGGFEGRHFNIEDGRKYATFQCIMLYYFKKK